MEKNNFNKAYLYIIAVFAIGVAISNIISFFNGVGFAVIGATLLLMLAIGNILKDEANKKRFGDIFVLLAFEFIMLIILFFAFDFNIDGITNKFPLVMRNICSIYSLLSIGYVVFRYTSEIKGKKYKFVEYMLGNYVPEKRVKEKKSKLSKAEIKKNKELENGTLAPKPSSVENVARSSEQTEVKAYEVKEETETQQQVENAENSEQTQNAENKEQNQTVNRTNFWY